jgi:hypothetical protein
MTGEPTRTLPPSLSDAERRQQERELARWRSWLPGWREAIATAEDEETLAGVALGKVLAEKDRLVAELQRVQAAPGVRVAYGEFTVDGGPSAASVGAANRLLVQLQEFVKLGGPEQEAAVRQSQVAKRLATLRQGLASLERQVRERARLLGVMLEPDEAPEPPPPPPQPPPPYTLYTPPPPPEPESPEAPASPLRARIAAGLARLEGREG